MLVLKQREGARENEDKKLRGSVLSKFLRPKQGVSVAERMRRPCDGGGHRSGSNPVTPMRFKSKCSKNLSVSAFFVPFFGCFLVIITG